MDTQAGIWALVLAAGNGSRLSKLTMTGAGVPVPKQFCSLQGGPSLLADALRRADTFAAPDRVCTVVAREHRGWWRRELRQLPSANVIVQPRNLGTGIGVLLALLYIHQRDPQARVVLLPSDHYVSDETALARAFHAMTAALVSHARTLLLLGVEPDEADPDLGYIVPGAGDAQDGYEVAAFVEKPDIMAALDLVRGGALWNAFIIAATVQDLLDRFQHHVPDVMTAMRTALEIDGSAPRRARVLARLYAELPTVDFSRQILGAECGGLRVFRAPHCGWTDLGTPGRVTAAVRKFGCGQSPASVAGNRRRAGAWPITILAHAASRDWNVKGGLGEVA